MGSGSVCFFLKVFSLRLFPVAIFNLNLGMRKTNKTMFFDWAFLPKKQNNLANTARLFCEVSKEILFVSERIAQPNEKSRSVGR